MARVRMDNLIEHFSSELRSVLTRPLTITVCRGAACRMPDRYVAYAPAHHSITASMRLASDRVTTLPKRARRPRQGWLRSTYRGFWSSPPLPCHSSETA